MAIKEKESYNISMLKKNIELPTKSQPCKYEDSMDKYNTPLDISENETYFFCISILLDISIQGHCIDSKSGNF